MAEPDSDADPDTFPSSPAPQTPTRNATKPDHNPRSSHHDAATPKTSPSGSPSLSLHLLGMSPFSPMRRHLSPSFTRSSSSPLYATEPEHSEDEEVVQDSKDVLVQRLNDLAAQLNQQDHLKEDNVNSLHAKVDEMERVVSSRGHPSPRRSQRSRPSSLVLQKSTSERDFFWGTLTPSRMPSISNIPLPTRKSSATQTTEDHSVANAKPASEPQMTPAQVNQIVEAAETLDKELQSVMTSLRARQEESDHIQSMLITRAERAAQRIIQLEKRTKELESERSEGEMEMLNLQIQLKAIEVQCLSYVPEDADEDLRESISAWKAEWSSLKKKRARRKASEDLGTPGTPTRQPKNKASSPG